jgi:pyrroline-5-carboxylate reductase
VLDTVNEKGIVLLGCGKMGSAMLEGWLAQGLQPEAATVLDPKPSDWLKGHEGVRINADLPESPAICLIAVKPQMIGEALPRLQALGNGDTLFISIAAGTSIATFEKLLGADTPIVRAMPNTPAAIGKGITALIGSSKVSEEQIALAETLLGAIGQTVRMGDEGQMDAVTAVSGSGPAYVFHMIEALAAAGEAEGLSPELALKLASATVSGAGQLAESSEEEPGQLRVNVTSPQGTTAAALEVLMADAGGLRELMTKAVGAAAERSRELGKAG